MTLPSKDAAVSRSDPSSSSSLRDRRGRSGRKQLSSGRIQAIFTSVGTPLGESRLSENSTHLAKNMLGEQVVAAQAFALRE